MNNLNEKVDIEIDKEINHKNIRSIKILFIFLLLFLFIFLFVIFILKPNWKYIVTGKLDIVSVAVNEYSNDNNCINVIINTDKILINDTITCYLSLDSNISDDDKYITIFNNKCEFKIFPKDYYIILANKSNEIVNTAKLTDYINKVIYIDINTDKQYLAVGAEKILDIELISIGNVNSEVVWNSTNLDIATVEDGKITAVSPGNASITVSDLYGNSRTIDVLVTDLINICGINNKKPLLKGEVYSLEESQLLDEILFSRVKEVGYNSRASVVAAARFLSLEFKYAIPYFFESGRLNNSGFTYVDGEGRYYHKGLYLHKSKFETIKASYVGPAIWGMPLLNYDTTDYYIPGVKYPNGLDCSGFVSWALFNGGFDPGDYGAGETPVPNQMTDLGEYVPITKKLLDSGKVKVGDIINYWGHVGIIIGIDDEKYYVAETLDVYKKLVVRSYKKSRLLKPFTYIVLMDSYYYKDGNYTQMW